MTVALYNDNLLLKIDFQTGILHEACSSNGRQMERPNLEQFATVD